MVEARLNLLKTRDIKRPTYYVTALQSEFNDFAYDEEKAQTYRGEWRAKSFQKGLDMPMDVEIGTGNGYFFSHRAQQQPHRLLVGVEIKFKPLIQSIRRALKNECRNARMVRYHAHFLENIFGPGEIDNLFIHHPDPWTRRRAVKHRLLNRHVLEKLFVLQKPNTLLEFKTDSSEYFFWAVEEFKNSRYEIERYTEDLHHSEWSGENFTTHFERIFLDKGQPIYYLRAIRR